MNSAQKWIVALGILAILATTFFAPYRWHGYNDFRLRMTGAREDLSGSAYGSLWSPPTNPQPDESRAKVEEVTLDAGKLGIWWGGIALLTAAGVALTAGRKRSQPLSS